VKIIIKSLSDFTNDPEDPTTGWPPPLNFMRQGCRTEGIGIWVESDERFLEEKHSAYAARVADNADFLIDQLGVGEHQAAPLEQEC
jgi:hypothetical protein